MQRFKVHDVEKSDKKFRELALEDLASKMADRVQPPPPCEDNFDEIPCEITMPAEQRKKFVFQGGKVNHPMNVVDPYGDSVDFGKCKNSFVNAVFVAYNKHLPLELSADDFWLAISQAIGQHLLANAEIHRDQFVDHRGKKTITAFTSGDLEDAIDQWTQLVKEDIKTDLADVLTKPFSTTGKIEQTVFNCTLLDAVKQYYHREMICICGIPEVTLHGTPEDFQEMKVRVLKLRKLFPDFAWFLDNINGPLNKLKATAEGKPNVDWWRDICHLSIYDYGESMLHGWITQFVAYKHDNGDNYERVTGGFSPEDLNPAVCCTECDVKNQFEPDQKPVSAVFQSGFLGTSQNPDTLALRPAMGWFLVAEEKEK